MSSETLSQQEIDLLFGGSADDQDPPAVRRGQVDPQLYDFRRPNLISKDRHRALQAMYGLLVTTLETWLTTRVREQVELQLLAVEHFSFGEFLLSLSTPCSSYIYDIAGSGGHQCAVDLGNEFAYYLVDRLLGGSGGAVEQTRGLTPLERSVVRLSADQIAEQLTEIWRDHVPLDLSLSRFESIPDMLQIANREDPVLVANVEVTAGGMRSLLLICLPFAVLEAFFTGPATRRIHALAGSPEDRKADRMGVEGSLLRTQVTVRVCLPEIQLSMPELLALKPGGVMTTGLPPEAELDVLVAGRTRYRAIPGRVGQRLASRIVDVLEPDPIGPAT